MFENLRKQVMIALEKGTERRLVTPRLLCAGQSYDTGKATLRVKILPGQAPHVSDEGEEDRNPSHCAPQDLLSAL